MKVTRNDVRYEIQNVAKTLETKYNTVNEIELEKWDFHLSREYGRLEGDGISSIETCVG